MIAWWENPQVIAIKGNMTKIPLSSNELLMMVYFAFKKMLLYFVLQFVEIQIFVKIPSEISLK